MKLLIDTNVLIDLIAPREPFASDIRKICIASAFDDVQLWASVQSYADAYYILCKYDSEDNVRQALLSTLRFFNPCSTYASDLEPALKSNWNDIEDFLIANSSKHIDARYLITRDLEMIERSPIPALTASDFLKMMEEVHGLVYDDIDI